MATNTKYIFLSLKERNGEYEYRHHSVHQLYDNKTATAEDFAQDYLEGFYGGLAEREDEGYYFFDGEVFVRISLWQFISKGTFNILRQYL